MPFCKPFKINKTEFFPIVGIAQGKERFPGTGNNRLSDPICEIDLLNCRGTDPPRRPSRKGSKAW